MLACFRRAATAGSRTMPSSMPRKITLLVVGMRLKIGAVLVGGNDTGVGAGCGGSPSPGTRSFGVVVVVVGGTVVVVVVEVVVELVVVGAADVVVGPVPVSSATVCTAAAVSVSGVAPPLSSNGPAPKSSTNAAVKPTATANRSQCGRA